MKRLDQGRRQAVVRKSEREILSDLGLAQQLERKLLATPLPDELRHQRAKGMRPDDGVHGTVGAEDQEACMLRLARQPPDQVQRGVVAPVQILENEYQGLLS